jgi:hypothetical protein
VQFSLAASRLAAPVEYYVDYAASRARSHTLGVVLARQVAGMVPVNVCGP